MRMHVGQGAQAERLVFPCHIMDLAAHHALYAGCDAKCLNETKPCCGIK